MRNSIYCISVLSILLLAACSSKNPSESRIVDTVVLPISDTVVADTAPRDVFTIVGTGDILLGMNYPDDAPRLPAADGIHLFDSVRHILSGADVAFGNLEGVLLDSGGIPKTCTDPKLCYRFRMPERYVQLLVDAGYDVMSVANNHVCDFGHEARMHTLDVLREAGLEFAGSLNQRFTVFERGGIRFGFCAFAAMRDCVSVFELQAAKKLIEEVRPQCDVLIVSMHAGKEGSAYMHVPFASEYDLDGVLGDVHYFAHLCIDAGADVFFGHGPHVPRAVELYRDRFIAYSLGNFCTPFGMAISGVSGLAPMIRVSVDRSGKFVSGQIFSGIQRWGTGPRLDTQMRVVREIQQLSEEDFPESPLRIASGGAITRK